MKETIMNVLKIHMRTAMAALAVLAGLSACQDPNEGKVDEPTLNEALELAVDVEDIAYTSAKIKVTHNGDKNDTWFGLLTEDVKADEDALINAAAKAYADGESSEGLRKSKSYVAVLKDLKPGTSYKYIAFGLSADGTVYGCPASVEFVTIASAGGDEGGNEGGNGGNEGGDEEVKYMKLNPAWTVTYGGEGVIDGTEYDHVVTVNSTDNNPYAITIVYASLWDENVLLEMANEFAADLVAYVEEYNQVNGTAFTVADALFKGTAMDAFDLYPGYYRAVALGITSQGKVSGLYAVSDVFEVKEQVPTEEYKAWLGDWTIKGDNGKDYTVTISRHVNNRSFWMFGWEGFEDIPVDVEYSQERNDLTFYAQLVQKDYYIQEAETTCNMYFFGVEENGDYYDIQEGEYGIAIAGVLDDGARALVRYGVNQPDYPKFSSMFYCAEIGGKYYYFTEDAELPSFRGIAEMSPAAATVAKSLVKKAPRNEMIAAKSVINKF